MTTCGASAFRMCFLIIHVYHRTYECGDSGRLVRHGCLERTLRLVHAQRPGAPPARRDWISWY